MPSRGDAASVSVPVPRRPQWLGRGAADPPAFYFAHAYGDHMVLKSAPKRAAVWGY
eukprot:gene11034-9634_t